MALRYESSKHERENTREMLPEPVYYIESSDDDTVLVGIDVAVESKADGTAVVTWFDTTRERAMTAEETKREDDYFAFKRSEAEGGQFYKFTPMDLDVYNDKVKNELISGQDFDNKDDLIQAFQATRRQISQADLSYRM